MAKALRKLAINSILEGVLFLLTIVSGTVIQQTFFLYDIFRTQNVSLLSLTVVLTIANSFMEFSLYSLTKSVWNNMKFLLIQ